MRLFGKTKEVAREEAIELPFNVKKASDLWVEVLIAYGALYRDETGLHASKPGTYPIRQELIEE